MATKKPTPEVMNIRLAAIYRSAVLKEMSRAYVEELLMNKAGYSAHEAGQLAGHWFTTAALR